MKLDRNILEKFSDKKLVKKLILISLRLECFSPKEMGKCNKDLYTYINYENFLK